MGRWLSVLVCLSACDTIFGSDFAVLDAVPDARPEDGPSFDALRVDRDDDGIYDDEDACVAPASELGHDEDNDSIPSHDDPCPFHNPNNGNDDGDLLGDACDSLRGVAGGTRRCAMSFPASAVNAQLWVPDAGGEDWNRGNGALTIPPAIGSAQRSIFATADVLGTPRTGTVSASVRVTLTASMAGNFILWMTASDDGVPDAGCRIQYNVGELELDVVGGDVTPRVLAQGGNTVLELRASYVRGLAQTTLTCATLQPGNPQSIGATIDVPPDGRLGFGTTQWGAAVEWLEVHEHP